MIYQRKLKNLIKEIMFLILQVKNFMCNYIDWIMEELFQISKSDLI
jgi:hypothetical protein